MVSGGRQQSQNKFTEQVQWHVDTYCIMLHDSMHACTFWRETYWGKFQNLEGPCFRS